MTPRRRPGLRFLRRWARCPSGRRACRTDRSPAEPIEGRSRGPGRLSLPAAPLSQVDQGGVAPQRGHCAAVPVVAPDRCLPRPRGVDRAGACRAPANQAPQRHGTHLALRGGRPGELQRDSRRRASPGGAPDAVRQAVPGVRGTAASGRCFRWRRTVSSCPASATTRDAYFTQSMPIVQFDNTSINAPEQT